MQAILLVNNQKDLDFLALQIDILDMYVENIIILSSLSNAVMYQNDSIYHKKIKLIPIEENVFDFRSEYIQKIIYKLGLHKDDDILISLVNYIPDVSFFSDALSEDGLKVFEHTKMNKYFNSVFVPYEKKNGTYILKYSDYSLFCENEIEEKIIPNSGWYFEEESPNVVYFYNSLIDKITDISKFQSKILPSLSSYLDVEGFFDFEELYDTILNMYDSGHFVEIGSYYGQSAIYMASKIKTFQKDIQLDCIDIWTNPDENIYQDFMNNIRKSFVEDVIKPIKADSREAFKLYEDNSIDFIFIDADHEYESVKLDITNWLPKLKPGGFFAGHDWHIDGVRQAVNEILIEAQGLEIDIINNSWIVKNDKIVRQKLDYSKKDFLIYDNIEKKSDLVRYVLHPPQKHQIVLKPEHEWEKYYYIHNSVIQTPEQYYMFYRAQPDKKYIENPFKGFICLATSNDGLHWDKPSLDIFEFNGSKNNNILYGGFATGESSESSIFLDTNPQAVDKFKAICKDYFTEDNFGMRVHTSNDAIHWNFHDYKNILNFHLDSTESAFWDERLKKYVIYVRSFDMNSPVHKEDINFREWKCLSRIETDNIQNEWPLKDYQGYYHRYKNTGYENVCVLTDNNLDLMLTPQNIREYYYNCDSETILNIYNCNVIQYDKNLYFMFLTLMADRRDLMEKWSSHSDILMLYSYDGVKWEFIDKQPYIYGHECENLGSIFVNNGIINHNNTIFHYYTGYHNDHYNLNYPKHISGVDKWFLRTLFNERDAGAYYCCEQTKDRFASLYSEKGYIVSKPFYFYGNEIELDYRCLSIGHIKVEILDENYNIINGFSINDSNVITGNQNNCKIGWNNNTSLDSLSNRIIRLRIYLNYAHFYKFRISQKENK